jgi:cAMP and cAMP-inhibited cGMP 3',5'-cyclic phosphodiesterase 10
MTCSDLTAMTKPWNSSRKTADSVYSEFFYQGDEEKKLGVPISANVMNRDNEGEIPAMQTGFYTAIVMPAFNLLSAVLPETSTLSDRATENYQKWKELQDAKIEYKIGHFE